VGSTPAYRLFFKLIPRKGKNMNNNEQIKKTIYNKHYNLKHHSIYRIEEELNKNYLTITNYNGIIFYVKPFYFLKLSYAYGDEETKWNIENLSVLNKEQAKQELEEYNRKIKNQYLNEYEQLKINLTREIKKAKKFKRFL